jgi:hypothetical protein
MVSTVVWVTGTASATLFNVGGFGSSYTYGPDTAAGSPFNCSLLTAPTPSASGSGFATGFTSILNTAPGSGTTTILFVAQ